MFAIRNLQPYESNVVIDIVNPMKNDSVQAIVTRFRGRSLFMCGTHSSMYAGTSRTRDGRSTSLLEKTI